MDVLKDSFGDNRVEGVVFERQKMTVADEIDFRGWFDFEIDDVWCTASSACTEVQDFRVTAELPEQAFNASVPTWGGIRTSNEEG